MNTVLLTGANGFLGQNIVSIFNRESDYSLIQTSVENSPALNYGQQYYQLDITNKEQVKNFIAEVKPSVIINAAAMTNVDQCETDREICWRLNVDAVKNLIIAARQVNAKIVHYSTDYVFDGKSGPYTEIDTPNPINFYGRSKLASENALIASGIDYIIIRTMVLYGLGLNNKQNFAIWLIYKLESGQPVNIVTDQIGNATIVDDLAFGTLKLIENDKNGIYNMAGEDILSRFDFTLKLCEVFGFDESLVFPIKTNELNQPAARPLNSGLITLKAKSELGLNFMDSLEGLRFLKSQMGY